MFNHIHNALKAVIAGVCLVAGAVAVYLPSGELKNGAQAVAERCEAGGFQAFPVDEASRLAHEEPNPGPIPPGLPGPIPTQPIE